MSPIQRFAAAATVSAVALVLAGCGEITIMSAGGSGTCEGKGAFTIETSQADDASNYQVDYNGPADVSLVITQALYLDSIAAIDPGATLPDGAESVAWTISGEDDTAVIARLDPANADGWSSTVTGSNVHHEFSGTFETLVSGHTLAGSDVNDIEFDKVVPAIVGVVCDDEIVSDIFGVSDPSVQYIDTIQLQAVGELDPRHIEIDPFIIEVQHAEGSGIMATARLSDSAVELFGDFTPTVLGEVELSLDVPEIPNETFGQLWFQALVSGGAPGLELAFPDGISLDGSFPVALSVTPEAETGNYVLLMLLADESDDVTDYRVVFMNLYFDADNGIAFLDPIGEPQNPDLSDDSELADTGVEFGSIAFVASGFVAAGITIAVARRRRTV